MSLLKFEFLKNAEMKRVVPVNGVKIVDKNGYIGADMTEYFPHQPYMNYVNYALVLNGPNYSKTGLGQVEFIDSEYLVNIGGRDYKTCTIGGMVWLAENLDYKFEINPETHETIALNPSGHPDIKAAWYYNRNELQYGIDGTYKCGLLYNWYAIKYLEDNKASLIPGWHVPTNTEWNNLMAEVGGSSVAGTALKAKDNTVTSEWPSLWGGEDSYGFNVAPSGVYGNDAFTDLGNQIRLWSINAYDSIYAYFQIINKNAAAPSISNHFGSKTWGAYIRLVKDAT